jgi:hypothetical protein
MRHRLRVLRCEAGVVTGIDREVVPRRKGKPGGGEMMGERDEARERMEAEGKGEEEAAMDQTALVYF